MCVPSNLNRRTRRRGVVFVQVLVLSVVMMGFAALTIDIGSLYNVRQDLQRSADAAAMAGVSAMTSDQMMRVRQTGDSSAFGGVLTSAYGRVDLFAAMNPSMGTETTLVQLSDIQSGVLDLSSATSLLNTGANPADFNAVQVAVQRDADGPNGPVEFLFASVLGMERGSTSATATAAYDDRFAGVDLSQLGDGMMPMTVHVDEFEAQMVSGDDDYEYDPDTESVIGGSDGVREIRIYPFDNQPGNFGLLNIGTPNQGTPALAAQIENGVTADDMEAEIGTSVLEFYDDEGNAVTYEITGNPGMKSSLESSLDQRIGDVVGYFLHDQQTGNGANAVYRITRIVYGRMMDAKLNGNPNQRGVWIQPISYVGGEVIVGTTAPSSGGLVGRIVLAR